jgi:alpha-ketoglutarate-dependent taurine dioxygenase
MIIGTLENSPFGAKVKNFDCASLDAASAEQIKAALYQHQVLVFEGQQYLTPTDEVRFYLQVDADADSIWRDQVENPWEVFKVDQGNTAGTYQLPGEPGVLVLGKGEIDHHGLKVTLGGGRAAYGDDAGSQVLGGGALQWHIDGTFYQHQPCNFTQMFCVEAPTGNGHWLDYADGSGDRLWCEAGSTAFASGRIAFAHLGSPDREIAISTTVHYPPDPFQVTYQLGNTANGLRVVDPEAEALHQSGQEVPGHPFSQPGAMVHPLVWHCPHSGEPALMPQPRCIDHLVRLDRLDAGPGGPLGKTASRLLVEEWMRPAIGPDRVYVHAWQAGDLVIWNNRSVWHSATGKLAREDRRIQHLTAYNGRTAPR